MTRMSSSALTAASGSTTMMSSSHHSYSNNHNNHSNHNNHNNHNNHHRSSSSLWNTATQIRYLWVALTSLIGAVSTFVIYERMYHSVEISQLYGVSIDHAHLALPQQPLPQQPQQLVEITTGPHPATNQQQQQQQESSSSRSVIRSLSQTNNHHQNHPLYFLNMSQVTHKDSFSASWLQSKRDFLDMDLSAVKICEDAAFKAWNTRKEKLRMPMDYFDFSVEHLSKWWKLLYYYNHDTVYNSVMSKLHAYIQRGAVDYPTPHYHPPLLHQTLATIAFQPYHAPPGEPPLAVERAYNLTVVSLAATIESLRRAEMGRVVVVGSVEEHAIYAQKSFDYLADILKLPHGDGSDATTSSSDNNNNIDRIGHLELAFVQLTQEQARTKLVARNMPKGALAGAREAFLVADLPAASRTPQQQATLDQWLGTRQQDPGAFWQYLYLTEPDSILTTRASALAHIKEEIDVRGGIVAPFRLQPIPHESDIPGYPRRDRFLPASDGFENVMELDHYDNNGDDSGTNNNNSRDVCCDEYAGHDHRPGKSDFPECGHKKWFLCGFEEKIPTEDPHRRLKPYKLFRLTRGTGLVTIAGNLFARRCLPAHNAVCKPPHVA